MPLLLSFAFLGCGSRQASKLANGPIEVDAEQRSMASLLKLRVVAFRFALPDDENFSLIQDGEFDGGSLSKLKKKEAELTENQVETLVEAVFGSHKETSSAACYDPHHIFLFFNDSDKLIQVVEVCFSCTNLRA